MTLNQIEWVLVLAASPFILAVYAYAIAKGARYGYLRGQCLYSSYTTKLVYLEYCRLAKESKKNQKESDSEAVKS